MTSTDQCVQATHDRCIPYETSADRYVQDKGYAGRPYTTSVDHCVLANNNKGRPLWHRLTLCAVQRRCAKVTPIEKYKRDRGRKLLTSNDHCACLRR